MRVRPSHTHTHTHLQTVRHNGTRFMTAKFCFDAFPRELRTHQSYLYSILELHSGKTQMAFVLSSVSGAIMNE